MSTVRAKAPQSRRPVCRVCRGQVLHGNLYCSKMCGSAAKGANEANAQKLTKCGFVRDPEIPNVYLKDGVATTLEHVAHVGLAKALAQHGHAAAVAR